MNRLIRSSLAVLCFSILTLAFAGAKAYATDNRWPTDGNGDPVILAELPANYTWCLIPGRYCAQTNGVCSNSPQLYMGVVYNSFKEFPAGDRNSYCAYTTGTSSNPCTIATQYQRKHCSDASLWLLAGCPGAPSATFALYFGVAGGGNTCPGF